MYKDMTQRRIAWGHRCCAVMLVLGTMLAIGCHQGSKGTTATQQGIDYSAVAVPTFDADSAYQYVADQVACGYRTPGSEGQRRCADYLTQKMRQWCDTVMVQNFTATLWDGRVVPGKNIIASIEGRQGTAAAKRVLMGAHWDSRLWADHDPDKANHRKPFDGANDGASGVGVLMELARAIATQPLYVAVDFIFFDVEDQGVPDWADTYEEDSWCLGSQYWSRNPHVPYYTAVYGVLLDMVGTQQPRYTKEQISRQYAGNIMNKMWTAADALGYGSIFVNSDTDPILDDHYYVNRLAGVPMIDVVQNSQGCSFFKHWHTMGDNMEHVDRNSLKTIGEVLLKLLYGDYGN